MEQLETGGNREDIGHSEPKVSVFVSAVLIVGFLVLLWQIAPEAFVTSGVQSGAPSPKGDESRTWTWWTFENLDHLQSQSPPETLFLGSSLMVVGMAECDATVFRERLDLTRYRGARYFDALSSVDSSPDSSSESSSISRSIDTRVDSTELCNRARSGSLNLASPGQLPSDAYLLVLECIRRGVVPSRIIYGIAPRDLYDGTVENPARTEPFLVLNKSLDVGNLLISFSPLSFENVLEVAQYFLSKGLFPCDFSTFKSALGGGLSTGFKTMEAMLPEEGQVDSSARLRRRMLLLPGYKPLDMVPGFLIAEPMSVSLPRIYIDNLSDYRARYHKPRESFFRAEVSCLKKLAALCRKKNIQLVLVNMPIRRCNLELLDSQNRMRYHQALDSISKSEAVDYLNLGGESPGGESRRKSANSDYRQSDYRDSVHLNGYGGIKFVNQLVRNLEEIHQGSKL